MILTVLAAAIICGPNVSTHPDGRDGVAVYVDAPGPDVITVDVTDGHSRHHKLIQQVPARSGGAEFDFSRIGPNPTVQVTSKNLGVCEAQ